MSGMPASSERNSENHQDRQKESHSFIESSEEEKLHTRFRTEKKAGKLDYSGIIKTHHVRGRKSKKGVTLANRQSHLTGNASGKTDPIDYDAVNPKITPAEKNSRIRLSLKRKKP